MFDCIYKIIDVTGDEPVEMVFSCSFSCDSGSYTKVCSRWFSSSLRTNGGTRKPSTDLETSLNNALREYDVAV
jgi:2,3,4,5-tetrahydropyridine-2-carboxylate N-succinyltransferase